MGRKRRREDERWRRGEEERRGGRGERWEGERKRGREVESRVRPFHLTYMGSTLI